MDVNVGTVAVDDDLAWEQPDVIVSRVSRAAVGAANPKMLGRLLLRRISPGGPANQSSKDSRLPSARARLGNRPVADTCKSAAGSAFPI